MNGPIDLSNQTARRFLLTKQGLWPPRALKGRAAVLAVFDLLSNMHQTVCGEGATTTIAGTGRSSPSICRQVVVYRLPPVGQRLAGDQLI
jgi:hypothetical protein